MALGDAARADRIGTASRGLRRNPPGDDVARELIAYCREQLADVKCPRSVDFRDELPRHPTGKLYKRLLKDEYWKGHDSHLL